MKEVRKECPIKETCHKLVDKKRLLKAPPNTLTIYVASLKKQENDNWDEIENCRKKNEWSCQMDFVHLEVFRTEESYVDSDESFR